MSGADEIGAALAGATVPAGADDYADMALHAFELGECLRALYGVCEEIIDLTEPELDARVRQALGLAPRPAAALDEATDAAIRAGMRELVCTCDAGVARLDAAVHALSCPMRDPRP